MHYLGLSHSIVPFFPGLKGPELVANQSLSSGNKVAHPPSHIPHKFSWNCLIKDSGIFTFTVYVLAFNCLSK
jgi:hypothetical protein